MHIRPSISYSVMSRTFHQHAARPLSETFRYAGDIYVCRVGLGEVGEVLVSGVAGIEWGVPDRDPPA